MSPKPYWIDTHAHVTSETLVGNIDSILQRSYEAHVHKIVNICTDHTSLAHAMAITSQNIQLFHAAAVTPHDVSSWGESFFPEVEKMAKERRLIAIGETGLDYYYEHSPKDAQIESLIKHLVLAKESSLPVIIHCREAFCDLLAILDQHYKSPSILIHCFTGTYEEAKACLDRGFMISMSGIVTFPKSTDLQQTFKKIPVESIFIETDSPYLAPVPFRGKVNEPAYLVHTAHFLAALKGFSLETLSEKLHQNFKSFFHP